MKKTITFKKVSDIMMVFAIVASMSFFSQRANAQVLWGTGADAISDSVGRFIKDFGTAGAWKPVTVTKDAVWIRTTDGVSKGKYWGTNQPFKSPTLADGAALFDSDFLDNGGVSEGTGPCPAPHHGELQSPVINLTGITSADNIEVKLFAYYRLFDVQDLSLGFSSDGGSTWKDYSLKVLGGETNKVYGQDYITIKLKDATKGVADFSNCKLRFVFNGDSYFAMFDNVSILKSPPYDIGFPLANAYGYNTAMSPSPYAQFPKRYAEKASDKDYFYSAVISNDGGTEIPVSANPKLTWELLKSAGAGTWNSVLKKSVVITKKIPGNDTTVVTGDITSDLNAAFVANGTGDYRFSYTVSCDLSDANASNNEIHYDFTITADLDTWFSAAPLNANGYPTANTNFFPAGGAGTVVQTFEQGLYYYFPDQKDLAMQSVRYQAYMSNSFDGDSQPVSIYVYDAIDLSDKKTWSLVALGIDTIKSSGNTGKYIEREAYLWDVAKAIKGYKLSGDGIYCIAVAQHNSKGLIDQSGKIHTVYPAACYTNNRLGEKVNYFYSGYLKVGTGAPEQTEAISYYSGFNSATPYVPSVSVKMIDGKSVGIIETQKESTILTVFPNPVADNLNVRIKTDQSGSQASFILTDITGRIISIEKGTLQNDMIYTIGMKGLPAGNYMIHVKTEKGNVSEKVVKY